jgi:hypothetical protein
VWEFIKLDDHFSIAMTRSIALVPESFQGQPLVQLAFDVLVPWILPEPWNE